MLDVVRDFRHGLRTLAREPGFGLTAIFTLALGIGATTALFTVVNAVILSPLPFPQSHQLMQVWRSELPSLTYGSASYARYLDWRREQRAFSDLGAYAPRGMTIGGADGPERVGGGTASASFFRVVGAAPVIGRYFADDEDQKGGPKVAIISEGLWKRRFQASASAVGAAMQIDGESYTIVGVAPSGYSEIWRLDVWAPLGAVADAGNRGSNFLLSFGRLREGMTIDAARRSLSTLAAQMTRDHPEDKYSFTAPKVRRAACGCCSAPPACCC
jgi:putative ABC transport system permease protein